MTARRLLRSVIIFIALILLSSALYSLPKESILQFSNYPNPFDSRLQDTAIIYYLNEDAKITLKIYDLFGYLVKEYSFSFGQNGARKGWNRITWNGEDEFGRKVSKGGYICSMYIETLNGSGTIYHKIGLIH